MKWIGKRTLILISLLVLTGVAALWMLRQYRQRAELAQYDLRLPEEFARLEPLFTKTSEPRQGEWLKKNPERGQTYQDYLRCSFRKPEPPNNVIYVLPLGDFTPEQMEILRQTTDFLQLYFNYPARMLAARPLPPIPPIARRKRDSKYGDQLCSQYLVDEVLPPHKPKDAFILVGFVGSDLWMGGAWNAVFGHASESKRVAVCSLARFCSAGKLAENRPLCLLRTLKVTAHECGHLFSMLHCIWFLCNMAGSNNLAEIDRHPLALCPQCFAKVCHAGGVKPIVQLEKLRNYCRQNGLSGEEKLYDDMFLRMQSE
jgi:archaemetzincin